MMGRIEEQWVSYRNEVVPNSAGVVQLTETKKAFYAGAAAFFNILMGGVGTDPDEEPTEKELALMDSLKAELDEYLAGLKEGKI